MAEIRTVTTLRSKRAEIIAAIANYEKRLAQARADLAHITAAITMLTSTDASSVARLSAYATKRSPAAR
jgi:hypothetical protein